MSQKDDLVHLKTMKNVTKIPSFNIQMPKYTYVKNMNNKKNKVCLYITSGV